MSICFLFAVAIAVKESAKIGGDRRTIKGVDDLGMWKFQQTIWTHEIIVVQLSLQTMFPHLRKGLGEHEEMLCKFWQ